MIHFSQLQVYWFIFLNLIQRNNLTCFSKKYFNFTWPNLETAAHLHLACGGTGWLSAAAGLGQVMPLSPCGAAVPCREWLFWGSGGSGSWREGQGSSQGGRTSTTLEFSHALVVSTMKEFCAIEHCTYHLTAR